MPRTRLSLRPLVLAVAFALLPGTVSAAGDSKPAPPAGAHDVTKPAEMAQASDQVSTAKIGSLSPRTVVAPIQPRSQAAAPAASPALSREVFGFAKADSLSDPNVGYTNWNFNLLTDVAYFGIHVNPDGTLVTSDSGWAVWQSSVASNFINTAHAAGVRVLLTLMLFDSSASQTAMCQALSGNNPQTTISAAQAQLKGADGIDIDYEGFNAPCGNTDVRHLLNQFVQKVRAANLGYLVIDTYASSAEDAGGFFDIPTLGGSVDAFFVMAYGLEAANGPCGTCMGPTSPHDGTSPAYVWNDTRAANGYAPWASQSILGLPYYGVAACVQPNPPPNAPVLPNGQARYSGVPYTVLSTLPSNPFVTSFQKQRDELDPNGQEPWASYNDTDPSLNCWREAYWDDAVSLAHKYDLVNQRGFRGAGIFTLDYGGRSRELWNDLLLAFGPPQTFQSLGGTLTVTSSPTAASWGLGRQDLFVRGGDNALWQKAWDGTSWSDWRSLGGGLTSAPAAVSWGFNRVDVFVRGTLGDLWQRAWDGTSWSDWRPLGGQLGGDPTVASWGINRLDVFAPALDGSLMQKAWDGASWSDWRNLGGGLSAGPGAVSWGFNRIDVFVRGTLSDLWHKCWCGGWSAWEPHGSTTNPSGPAVASIAPNRLDVYAPGQDGGLLRMLWNGSGWSAPAPFGPRGSWQFGPGAVSQPGSGHVDLFVVGADSTVWHEQV